MKYIKYSIATFASLLALYFLVMLFVTEFYSVNPIAAITCSLSGGKYTRSGMESPLSSGPRFPFSGEGYVCGREFSDAGTACTSNDDCQGVCLVTEDTILETREPSFTGIFVPKVVGGTGICSSRNYGEEARRPHFSFPLDVRGVVY